MDRSRKQSGAHSLAPPGTPPPGTYAGLCAEREWLRREAARAQHLTDAERIAILQDLLRTLAAVRRTKSPADLAREDEARRQLDERPGRARYLACVERCG